MKNTLSQLEAYLPKNAYRIVLSKPVKGAGPYQRVSIDRADGAYRAEMLTDKQAFHEDVSALEEYLCGMFGSCFAQMNAWDDAYEYSYRLTKNDTFLYTRRKAGGAVPKTRAAHDREKAYLLASGEAVAPLVDMGVMTPEGKVVQAMYGKFKQINRFLEIIDDEVGRLDAAAPLRVIDFGCGKSYLTFVLYHYFTRIRGLAVEMVGLDLKEDVIEKCNAAAVKYGYEGLHFEKGDISKYHNEGPIDMVVTLHACDTATDYALLNAIRWQARLIFSVPCCQHELNAQIETEDLSLLTRYGIIQERTAALLTDAIRGNLLTACGYKTQILEFVDLAHTAKNLLIRAARTNTPEHVRERALGEVRRAMAAFSLNPALYRLLAEEGKL